jgi:hypothetical protein
LFAGTDISQLSHDFLPLVHTKHPAFYLSAIAVTLFAPPASGLKIKNKY